VSGVVGLNLATAWEAVADAVGDEQALICGDTIRTWREFDDRGSRIAAALAAAGIAAGDNVGLCLFNGNEYSEAQFGTMKVRASPFNINYRYTAEELRSLLDDADARAVFYSADLRDRFAEIAATLPEVRCWIEVGADPGGSVAPFASAYEELVAGHEPAARIERSGEDLWLLFTGGTTGNPKGVMWPHESIIGTMAGTYQAMKMAMPATVDEVVERVLEIRGRGFVTRQLAAAPLMHGTSGITALSTLIQGGCVLTLPGQHFDADALFTCVQHHRASHLTIVGDAFTRPMLDALRGAVERGEPYDLSSIFLVMSSGVMWSASMKAALFEFNPKMKLLDSLGSSEGVGFARKLEGDAEHASTARFSLGPDTIVITEDGRVVEAGSGEKGRLALGGHLPLGYYKDPVKSAETFPVIDGKRYSIPGDWATVEADGSIVLLGRGSVCINTGGEKVYPEEVEEALKLVPGIVDANVVGVPDERWGQAVTAVVQLDDGATIDDGAIKSAVKEHLAGYKAPKHIIRVPQLLRSSNGKSDYRWAGATAREALGIDG
jgi:fatty-acyl-CoA synthase